MSLSSSKDIKTAVSVYLNTVYTLGMSLLDSRVLSISSSSAEKVIGHPAESENYGGVLATLEHCHEENFSQRRPGGQCVLSVVNNGQRTGKRQMGMQSQQYRTAKWIKEKEGRLVFAATNVFCNSARIMECTKYICNLKFYNCFLVLVDRCRQVFDSQFSRIFDMIKSGSDVS